MKREIKIAKRLSRLFQVTVSIKLFGVEILHMEFPPASSSQDGEDSNSSSSETFNL